MLFRLALSKRILRPLALTACLLLTAGLSAAPTPPQPASIEFTKETLPNGLDVIYAPLHQAPVIHVRVLYHVGSRDERPDRQGFAHMFEHMMFRGSAHVAPEQHMKLVSMVGGHCNAFTSFDQTVYVNTLPSNQLEMVLYLEADRMASFKVSEDIYKTERKVVAQEWSLGQNRPYGTMFEDFFKSAYTTHSYRWTPIGNMQHLQAAPVNELQDFFNTYYLPNNALLVIAGDFKTADAQGLVRKYFAWIPRGPQVQRNIPAEPAQTEPRHVVIPQRVPQSAVMIGYHLPPIRSDEHYPLEVLGTILGDGRSSRLDRLLVNCAAPQCMNVSAGDSALEDSGIFIVRATVLNGHSAQEVEKQLADAVASVCANGVTSDELQKARTQIRLGIIRDRETANDLATQLGQETLFGGDSNRVNTELGKIEAITTADIQAVARKYLQPQLATTLYVKPDALGRDARAATTAAAAINEGLVTPLSAPIAARDVAFPADYPQQAPVAGLGNVPEFQKGEEIQVNGVRIIVLSDHRLPLVNGTLALRRASQNEPPGKEGVGGLTAEMLRRGSGNLSYAQFSDDLESRAISLGIADQADHTNLNIFCTTDQLDHAFVRAREMLLSPTFPGDEFDKLKEQTINHLTADQENAGTVASHELAASVYGDSVFGRYATPASVASITLDDVKDYYKKIYVPQDAIMVLSGDITIAQARELATRLLDGWQGNLIAAADYTMPAYKRRVILIDRPDARQATIRAGLPAYDIHCQDKFAGSLANMVLNGSMDSRMVKYVRAQLGLVYGIGSSFTPYRNNGIFNLGTDCKIETTARTISASLKVIDGVCSAPPSPDELKDAKLRVAGSMVMNMQLIRQQADMRLEGILNDYPADYYDKLPSRLAQVTGEEVRQVMDKYVDSPEMTIVVVAPAAAVKEQLEKRFGPVEVVPMPAQRGATTTPATKELMH